MQDPGSRIQFGISDNWSVIELKYLILCRLYSSSPALYSIRQMCDALTILLAEFSSHTLLSVSCSDAKKKEKCAQNGISLWTYFEILTLLERQEKMKREC